VSNDLYAERLAWFKQNERPEAVLVIAEKPDLIRVVLAWSHTKVTPIKKQSSLADESEAAIWQWLWDNAEYSLQDVRKTLTTYVSEPTLARTMRALIGSRVLYPDGTVHSFVQRYLRDRIVKIFNTPTKGPSVKRRNKSP